MWSTRNLFIVFLFVFSAARAATIGTVVPVVGGASDIVLDETRGRLYLVNSTRNQVEVYSVPQRRFLTPIPVEQLPLAAAMSRNGKVLYVTSHTGTALIEIDLDQLAVARRVSLPARPEGVAVGADERVLISTVGTGQNNLFNVLLTYDPFSSDPAKTLQAVTVPPPPPASPLLPPNNLGRPALIPRSFLSTSADGQYIIGVNIPNTTNRAVFVYEVASASVLRSRTMAGVSSVLSVAPDGSRFMAGLNLIDTGTLTIIAQQNAANAPYAFANGTNFNLQQNQGGSVYVPDGSRLYSAFNFAPVQTPAARANVSQLMVNDPDNLLIETAYQLPENVAGKMVITSDGATVFALSESGFLSIPAGTARQNPIAMADTNVVLLLNDQCGVTSGQRTGAIQLRNEGRGRLTATAQLWQQTPTGPGGLGGAGGPGGGAPGGGVIIIIPPIAGGGNQPVVTPPVLPGGQQTPANNNIALTAPASRPTVTPEGVRFDFTYNANAARTLGTANPTHQFLIQSNDAINIPPVVRVFQNNREAEARGDIIPIPVALSANEGLVDMIQDTTRQRLYLANSGLNRVEVFDMRTKQLMAPIKVGQLPRSLALSPDGLTLYVANTGGESISIIDLETQQQVGRVKFPAFPFNANVALISPQVIASTQRGPLVLMNNGTLWRIVGDEAVPRPFNTAVLPPNAQGQQILTAPRTMAASPNGDYVIVLAGNGFAYLYDAASDDFIQGRQVTAANAGGFYGPVAVGPRGQYFLVNGFVLNQALTTVGDSGTIPGGQPNVTTTRPIAAVTAMGTTTFARFVQPAIAANANALVNDNPSVEIVDLNTGQAIRSSQALERPLTTPTGNQRAAVPGRSMALDAAGTTAYVLTTSGLSVVQMDVPPPAQRPAVNPNGTVSIASYTTAISQGSLISIFGRNLGESAAASSTPLPTMMGGACVTLNNRPLPLSLVTPGQINAQIPPDLAAGRYPLVIRAIDRMTASLPAQITVSRFAPAVFVNAETGLPAIFHPDGAAVSKERPAIRDHTLTMYATGLGLTTGGRVVAGQPSPSDPLAITGNVDVYFGDPTIRGTEMIVEWSGLVPGYVGLYQINLRVPGARWRGEKLPVVVRIGGVSSPVTGPAVPYVTVD